MMTDTWQTRLESHRVFVLAQLRTLFLHTSDKSDVRAMAGRVICDYQSQTSTIAQLAQNLQQKVSGQRCLPDDMEYAYASTVVSVARELGLIGREALEVFTGYREEDLAMLHGMASEALSEAYVSLYGHPFGHV